MIGLTKKFNAFSLMAMLVATTLVGCSKEEDDIPIAPPEEENVPEVFTDVTLVFTNASDPNDVVMATAQDPDGEGAMGLTILDTINLSAGATYNLTYSIFNNLLSPPANLVNEILDEDNDHQFFYNFTDNIFMSPGGDGNIDNTSNPINYDDMDENNLPVGLRTSWTTPATAMSGTFRTNLQHQPGLKTATSDSNDGDTDFDLTFVLNIQ